MKQLCPCCFSAAYGQAKCVIVYIGCSEEEVCAFCYLKSYMASLTISIKGAPLFTHHNGVVLSKTYLVSNVKLLLCLQGLNQDFSGHSFRAGAATSASVAKFNEWELKRLGRWKSNAYDVYLRKPELAAKFAARLTVG